MRQSLLGSCNLYVLQPIIVYEPETYRQVNHSLTYIKVAGSVIECAESNVRNS